MQIKMQAAELVQYGLSCGLLQPQDRTWAYNTLLDELERDDRAPRQRLIARLMPSPSETARRFADLHAVDPRSATDWLYRLERHAEYVQPDDANIKWTTPTEWGDLQITVNKAKPEKDPADIAAAATADDETAYPRCSLCLENEGYAGRPAGSAEGAWPARQNLRIVPLLLGGQPWGLQYSPYSYYNEHCIAMNAEHIPMRIDRGALERMIDFVDLFPHYFIGSNAELPIVGGSVLSHDHFQGGRHDFPMQHAIQRESFRFPQYPAVRGWVLKWPVSTLRLRSESREWLIEAACHVLDVWRGYTDESVGVVASTDGVPHNTVTPILRKEGISYELDMALRCNVTSAEHPLGVFHPHEHLWRVKKENIGLIEVMGLAILPPRVDGEFDLSSQDARDEVGRAFAEVLECAGVFKWDDAGRAAQARFIDALM